MYKRRRRASTAVRRPYKRPRTITVSTVRTSGLAPLRTGGYFGVQGRRRVNEKKTIDVAPGLSACDTTGLVTLLNGVATGTDFTDRIGRKIIVKSIFIRGLIAPQDGGTTNNLARVMLVYDMQSNGAAPAITDILKTSDAASQLNLNNRDRFKILMDKQFAMGGVDTTIGYAISPSIAQLKKYRKCYLETLYNGTTNAVGSIATGAIFLVTVGNQAAGAGSNFYVSTRVRFEDA